MPSAIRPCDLASTPTTIWMVDNTRLTPTLTQVLRDAAAERCAGVCSESSESSEKSLNFMVRRVGRAERARKTALVIA